MISGERRQRYLREMGYQPLRLRGRSATPSAPAATTPSAAAPATAASTSGPRRHPDPLWRALLAAAGAPQADLADLGWQEVLEGPAFGFDGPCLRINPIALRQQPAAKRALWKTLRGLRRRHATRP